MKKFQKVKREAKTSTKSLFSACEGTILNMMKFQFLKNSQEKNFKKTLRKYFFYFLKKLECFKNAVCSSLRVFLLSIFHLSTINLFICKNYNEL